jgi:hypothetical protein
MVAAAAYSNPEAALAQKVRDSAHKSFLLLFPEKEGFPSL